MLCTILHGGSKFTHEQLQRVGQFFANEPKCTPAIEGGSHSLLELEKIVADIEKSTGQIAEATAPLSIPAKYIPLQQEIVTLRQMFDHKRTCWGKMKNKFLKIDYEHILGMDITEKLKAVG